jgi:3-oxoacyl-[acyl-carrier protein] reductase
MTDLTGKVAIVTGSARGIGKAIATRYSSLGASVVVNYSRDADNANELVETLRARGGQAIAVRADISSVADIDTLFNSAIAEFGKVDIVVANAGLEVLQEPVLDATEEQFDRLFAVNTKGTFFTLQRAALHIVDGGRIVYIGSSTTATAIPGTGLYGSSKTAARHLVGVLALELASRGVTVNTILPTTTDGAGVFTGLPDDHPVRAQLAMLRGGVRMGTPDDVADAAEYFASNLSGFVSGQALLVSGGPSL